MAGKRAGLAGERSGLFMEQIRIVKEMRSKYVRVGGSNQLVRLPRYCVFENVPGVFSSNGGKDFQAVLTEFVKVCEPDAPDVPLPEKGKWPKAGCIYDDLGRWSIAWRVHNSQYWGVPQRRKRIALVADFGGLSAPEILFERKGLRWDYESCGEEREEAARAAGKSIETANCFGIDQQGGKGSANYSEDICPPILSDSHGTPHAVSYKQPIMIEMTSTKNTIVKDGTSPTLTARMGTGGNQVNAVMCYQNTGRGWWNESDVGATIRTPCGGDSTKANLVKYGFSVRRLTPLECERLQGFPDGWTYIGEWTDSTGKKHKDADSPRYKALGNSIAIPFWQFLARRICAQYERPVTIGSLFDGIGGFPLAFSRCGAIPVWASEIEEFPIAVTKKHFPEAE